MSQKSVSCFEICSQDACSEAAPMIEEAACDPCYTMPVCNPCCPPKRCKSRELRSSILMTQCDCVKRNGLQYDCPRRNCGGRPCCITKPIPVCCPSRYMWRYANVSMGKPTMISRPKADCKPVAKDCNPCPVNEHDECC